MDFPRRFWAHIAHFQAAGLSYHSGLPNDFGQHQFWVTQYGGTKQGLGLQDVRDVVLPVPPPAEQTDLLAKLETRLSALTRLRTRIDHQVSRLREYRQVLISAAVTGKIDVTKETAC